MKHYLNICDINGAEIEPVDVITFGSPCQSMSISGKREGIKHTENGDSETTRSGLFYEATRIIREMRNATNGKYPRFIVWENVQGAFSSNKGNDFYKVLEEICSLCTDGFNVPRCEDKRTGKLIWKSAGEIVGDNWSVCWRTVDAQYWGVPQRRKRVYLVADFNTQRAREVSFKQESLRGNMQTSIETRETITTDTVGGPNGSIGTGIANSGEIANCLDASYYKGCGEQNGIERTIICCEPGVMSRCGGHWCKDVSCTLRANAGDNQPVIALQANGIDRADTAGCNGCGYNEIGVAYTLNTVDRHAVCFDRATFNQGINAQYGCEISEDGINSTLVAKGPSGIAYESPVMLEHHPHDSRLKIDDSGTCQALTNRMGTGGGNVPLCMLPAKACRYTVRRLIPAECARLQGMPTCWGVLSKIEDMSDEDVAFWNECLKVNSDINGKKFKEKTKEQMIKWYNKLHTDSAEYKMWGNGVAFPNAEYFIKGIAKQGAKTLGSLFDGSGAFPLAGLKNGITPIWASEIEPYPIAVTKERFN